MSQELILKAELRPTEEMTTMLRSGTGIVDMANACEIDCADMAAIANDEMRDLKKRFKRIKELHASFIEPAKQMVKNADDLFKPTMAALEQGEAIYKRKLLAWTAEQERKAEEERRAAAERARQVRADAEAKAQAERARAQQEAAEKKRLADEAETQRLKAIEEGRAEEAAAAAATAAHLRVEARSIVSDAEDRAVEAQLEAESATVMPMVAQTAPAGFQKRKNWVAEYEKDEQYAIVSIAAAITSGRADLIGLLSINTSAANKLAKALESNMAVPGMRAANQPIAASRAA